MTETIIPGTYIDVRAEALISAGQVATGVVGVVGTAASGAVGEPVTLSMPSEGRARFGAPDDIRDPEDGSNPLTLSRAVDLVYGNGASTVVAVRVAGSSRSSASLELRDDDGRSVAVLTATTPGTWGNEVRVRVEPSDEDCLVEREAVPAPFDEVRHTPVVPSPRNRLRVRRGATGRVDGFEVVYRRLVADESVSPNAAGRYFLSSKPVEEGVPATRVRVLDGSGAQTADYSGDAIEYGPGGAPEEDKIRIDTEQGEVVFSAAGVPDPGSEVIATYAVGHPAPTTGQVRWTTWSGRLDYAADEAPSQTAGDTLEATYLVHRDSCVSVRIQGPDGAERYVAADAEMLCERVNRGSRLVTAEPDEARLRSRPVPVDARLGSGSNVRGSNGAEADGDDYALGLEALADELVNIVVAAGQDVRTAGRALLGHVTATEPAEHERIGVIGVSGDTVDDLVAHDLASDRIVAVAPALRQPDGGVLPAGYTAAAVAGLLASVSVQTSLTSKPLNVPGLVQIFNRGEQAQLIRGGVLAVIRKNGFRVLRGQTTQGEGMPFSSIPIRRIVDYARYGVRSAANPYIGRLNNQRVRDALKATLDGFLTRMVEDEALNRYELNVFATRAQEIRGEVSVVMTLWPVFSIERVIVTLFLQ